MKITTKDYINYKRFFFGSGETPVHLEPSVLETIKSKVSNILGYHVPTKNQNWPKFKSIA